MFCTSRRIRHRAIDDLLPGRRDAREVAAVAHEDLESELVFEQLDLLADAGLRGVQLLGGGGDVEAVLGDGGEIAQLVQFHGCRLYARSVGN